MMKKENVNNQLDAELAHAGEETALSPKMLLLEELRITPEKELRPMDFLFRLFGRRCFPRRELVGITGKAKSGKTFVVSMLMACCVMRDVLNFHREEEKGLKVMWYDTEQSDESTQDILKNRILPMIGPSSDEVCFDIFNVRSVDWKERRDLLKEAIARGQPDLVVIDGIRDLVNDINDGVLAQEVMEELMHLATEHNCCIVCVLHQNKGSDDHNLRGWIGTELMNKAFEVYACEKLMPQCIFKVQQALTRKYDIEQPMYFEVGDDGLPVVSGEPSDEGRGSQRQERLPPLNQAYRVYDENGKGSFDVPRLFNDALQGECEVQAQVYRERVMQLSGIAIPFKYNQLLNEALKQKVIIKVQRDKLTYYQAAPF